MNYLDDLTCVCRRCHEIFHGVVPEPEEPKPKKQKAVKAKLVDMAWVDANMPAGDFITLDSELINRTRTPRGGFTNDTIRWLKPDSLESGWAKRLHGKVLIREEYRLALIGRYNLKTTAAIPWPT